MKIGAAEAGTETKIDWDEIRPRHASHGGLAGRTATNRATPRPRLLFFAMGKKSCRAGRSPECANATRSRLCLRARLMAIRETLAGPGWTVCVRRFGSYFFVFFFFFLFFVVSVSFCFPLFFAPFFFVFFFFPCRPFLSRTGRLGRAKKIVCRDGWAEWEASSRTVLSA